MYSKAPASGAATQGPTIRADSAPITSAPVYRPPGMREDRSDSMAWMPEGIWNVNTSNMASASTASRMAKSDRIHGVCSQAASPAPLSPAATPSAVYTTDMPSTYVAASARPRLRLGRWCCAPPSTIDDRMGIMGSTHGVKASSRPSTKKTPAVLIQPRPPKASARPVSPAFTNADNPPEVAGAADAAPPIPVPATA